jgi:SAM-dependent methyltransferase
MATSDYQSAYREHWQRLERELGGTEALEQAVGGNFEAVGRLEFELLRTLGLQPTHTVVDVGCGSGRLACQLAALPGLGYLGTDVVGDLLVYARRLSGRPDWRFLEVDTITIPAPDASADFVCFFSVFTHLLHEDSYRYLAEARRVLKPGGRIVFSFLEFRIGCHWEVFKAMLNSSHGKHLNQFMDRDAIAAWANHLGLEQDQIIDGDRPHIPLSAPVRWDDGRMMSDMGNLGQSVAVLRRP